jgi:hypothetical protein
VYVIDVDREQQCSQKEDIVPRCAVAPALDLIVVVVVTVAWVPVVSLEQQGKGEGRKYVAIRVGDLEEASFQGFMVTEEDDVTINNRIEPCARDEGPERVSSQGDCANLAELFLRCSVEREGRM